MIELLPLEFKPNLKRAIWGGIKICRYKGIPDAGPDVGESWEISALPEHESVVASGPYTGARLTELVERFGAELLGSDVFERYGHRFPLLVKIIDASDNLSVQVHPDDNLALERHDSLGKTEMWYIIRADNDAKIYAGMTGKMTPEEYLRRIDEGTFRDSLAVYDSHPGDVFFLPAGTVHAIGSGNLLAEIQESSDITYRIYDYDRRDSDGNPRELHTSQAVDAIDFSIDSAYRFNCLDSDEADKVIAECEHFTTRRLNLDGETTLSSDGRSFTVVMCLEGSAAVTTPAGEMRLTAGNTILLPAAIPATTLRGEATLLVCRS